MVHHWRNRTKVVWVGLEEKVGENEKHLKCWKFVLLLTRGMHNEGKINYQQTQTKVRDWNFNDANIFDNSQLGGMSKTALKYQNNARHQIRVLWDAMLHKKAWRHFSAFEWETVNVGLSFLIGMPSILPSKGNSQTKG